MTIRQPNLPGLNDDEAIIPFYSYRPSVKSNDMSRPKQSVAVDGKALREHRQRCGLSARIVAQHLGVSEDTVELAERRGSARPEQIRRMCQIYGIDPFEVGAAIPIARNEEESVQLTLIKISTGERLSTLLNALTSSEEVTAIWHRRVTDRGLLAPESVRTAIGSLQTLVKDYGSRDPKYGDLLEQFEFDTAVAECLKILRNHRLYLYGQPFYVRQAHFEIEYGGVSTPCAALALSNDNTTRVIVNQRPYDIVDEMRNHEAEVVPKIDW